VFKKKQIFSRNRTCQKLHQTEHKNYCGFRSSDNYEVLGTPFIRFRSSDNYEVLGTPFIISLPESKLNCENVFKQIRIYAKYEVLSKENDCQSVFFRMFRRSVDIHIEHKTRRLSETSSDDDETYEQKNNS